MVTLIFSVFYGGKSGKARETAVGCSRPQTVPTDAVPLASFLPSHWAAGKAAPDAKATTAWGSCRRGGTGSVWQGRSNPKGCLISQPAPCSNSKGKMRLLLTSHFVTLASPPCG